ncbi:MAG: ABC transporter substrate-binding protein [Desulfomonilaceae bacterium]|nr:ABC transporter substrate-binding protein [Desulfomonilaceae bacterium]
MMSAAGRSIGRIAGYALLVFLVLALVGPSPSMADKPKSLAVAIIGDLTGPYASVVGPMAPGCEDAVKYVNEKLGGIDGVKMELLVKDNTGKAALGIQQYEELINMKPKPLFFGVPHTPTAEALREKVLRDEAIGFFPSSIDDLYPQGNTYGFYALYAGMTATAVRWVKDNWKEERNPRIAIITWDQAYGRAPLIPEFFDYCKKIGVDIVAQELFGVRDVDLTTHLTRIKAQKPDWLLTNCTGSGPVAIMRAAKELGMKTKLLNTVGGGWGTMRLDPALFEGCVSVLHNISYDNETHPGVKLVKQYLKENNRSIKEQTNFYIIGWQYILMIHKVVQSAAAKVGWDKLDTAAIKAELNTLTNWEPLDGIVKVTYTEKKRSSPWLVVYKIEGGKLVPAGGLGGEGKFVEAPDMTPENFR